MRHSVHLPSQYIRADFKRLVEGAAQAHQVTMRKTLLLPLIAGLSLCSCSADYPIKAILLNNRLAFVGAEKDWFFGSTGFCPSYFSVRDESGETVWRIENDRGAIDCKIFPLFYGVAPEEWRVAVPAKPFKSGHLYVVNGEGGDRYHGAFHYRASCVLHLENDPDAARNFDNPSYSWPAESAMDEL